MSANKLNVNQINKLASEEFVNKFGNIVECYPDIAKSLDKLRPFQSADDFFNKIFAYLDQLPLDIKEAILKLHPDLAGRLADENKLTDESTREQAAAGLNFLTPEDKTELRQLNERYYEKFGFPFVICARENKFNAIINGLKQRYHNTVNDEIVTGFEEVKKICKLRVLELINA